MPVFSNARTSVSTILRTAASALASVRQRWVFVPPSSFTGSVSCKNLALAQPLSVLRLYSMRRRFAASCASLSVSQPIKLSFALVSRIAPNNAAWPSGKSMYSVSTISISAS